MCAAESVRLVLVARHPVVCVGLRCVLEKYEGVQVVGEASSAKDAVALLLREQVDLVILDPDSTEVSLAAVAALSKASSSRILVFTAATDPNACIRAVELGASGVVSKSQPSELLVRAVRKIHSGEIWLDRAQTAMVLTHAMRRGQDPEDAKIHSLTRREREIVAKVGEGLRNSAIAEQLFISEATVRNHLTSILSKLGLADRFDLAVYAFRHNLLDGVPLVSTARGPQNGGAGVHAGDGEAPRARESVLPPELGPRS